MDPGTNLSGVSISVYSAMFLRILTLIKSISHIFRYMIINVFFVMMNVQLSVITLVLWEEVFFLEITANKIFFTKPIMQSLSFVFIVNKAQIDPKMSMLTCQTTDRPHCVWKLCLYVTARSEYLNEARWNVNQHSCGIFLPLWANWSIFLWNYSILFSMNFLRCWGGEFV